MKEENFKNLGKNIKTLRVRAGWSQSNLGLVAGIHHTTISLLENGLQRNPRIDMVMRLADALVVDFSDLLFKNYRVMQND